MLHVYAGLFSWLESFGTPFVTLAHEQMLSIFCPSLLNMFKGKVILETDLKGFVRS
uniref:Uncharacterized protein n=1 Tax=Rhizophora mucronata TaxID=61149 RepID=A0A2P2PEP0_RHIMU